MRFFHGALIVVFMIHCTAMRLCCCALLCVFMIHCTARRLCCCALLCVFMIHSTARRLCCCALLAVFMIRCTAMGLCCCALLCVFMIHSTARRLCCCALLGVFMMVAFGIIAGIFIISIEIAYKRHRRLKEKELELAKTAADRWRGNIEVSFVYVTSCHTVWHCHSVNVLSIYREVSTLSGCLLTLCLFVMNCSHCLSVY